ncbi:MAG: HD-GYP domain-containing protein [Spirochaetes bacterium]|nr:HD-GYP domain-containing protein [Spirochaetota bacterium]
MRKIQVEELKPGMRFDKPVYIDSNNIFIGANITIKEDDIKKLMRWGVSDLETAGTMISSREEIKQYSRRMESQGVSDSKRIITDYTNLLKKRKNLIEVHKRACKAVGDVYSAIKNGENFITDDLELALSDIIDLIKENNNIFLFLYGLDEGKNYLMYHSVNVTFYALLIGLGLKYSPVKLRELGLGTLLIDAGMAKIPVYITHKQSSLTEQEFNLIKTHPIHGYKCLRDLGKVKESIALVSLQHQEQFDGSGYPRGLKGSMISEYARIASIADSYEAQIVNRSYKKKQLFYHAMKQLVAQGSNRFDPVILRVFISKMSVYPIGSIVELNDNSIGIVIGSTQDKPLRPIIKLVFDSHRKKIEDTIILSLPDEPAFFIIKVLDEKEAGINLLEVL